MEMAKIDTQELKSFLDLCTYYEQFISGFADVVKRLTRLSREVSFLLAPGGGSHFPVTEGGPL
jgi:hypothetical protein